MLVSAMISVTGCASPALDDDDDDDGGGLFVPGDSAPTMDDCAAWLADQHDPSQPAVCSEQDGEPDWRAEIVAAGAVVYPVSADRYATVWLPEAWAFGDPLLYIVHNTDGCGEQLSSLWDRARGENALGFVSISYRAPGSEQFDPEGIVYDNLTTVHDALELHCPISASPKAYYGFSRGAARAYGISFLDRAAEAPFLDTFIIDSGTAPVSAGGAAPDALEGARFWMWCGERDPDPVNAGETICDTMRGSLAPLLSSFGGSVDALVANEDGCHGMLFDCGQTCADCRPHDGPTQGDLPELFRYLSTLSPQ